MRRQAWRRACPMPRRPALMPPPGLGGPPPVQSSQSMAAALQQARLAAGPVPGWAGLQGQGQQQQQPTDQGAALLAHLQNQARTSMGQMRPQEPSGEHLSLLIVLLVWLFPNSKQRSQSQIHHPVAAPGCMIAQNKYSWRQRHCVKSLWNSMLLTGYCPEYAINLCSRSSAAFNAPAAAAATAPAAASAAAGLPWVAASWGAWTAEQRWRCPASGPAAGVPAHAAGATAKHASSVFHGQRRYDI